MRTGSTPGKALLSSLPKVALAAALVVVLVLPFALRPRERDEHGGLKRSNLPLRTLVVISPHQEGIRREFERAFSEWTERNYGHRTDVDWIDVGGTSDDIRFVRSEFARSPDGIDIDLFFGGGVDPYLQLSRDGLLSPCSLPKKVLDAIPQKFAGIEIYDAKHRWFGACLAGFGILYNRKVLEILGLPSPTTWEDLSRPEYFTWVGSGDPRSSGSIHMMYEIILQAYGWEKGWSVVVRMGANTRNFTRAASQVAKDCAVGEVACGMVIDSYGWRQVAEVGEDRMAFVLPEAVTVVNPDGIGVLKGAPNRDLAEKFVEFVLSEPGQKLWILKAGAQGGPREFELARLPVIPGLAARFGKDAAVSFDPYEWKPGFTYDSEKGSVRWGALNDLIGAAIIDTHEELVSAWREVKGLPADHPLMAQFARAPLSEQDLLEMAGKKWNDPAFRGATRAQWARDAMERYRRIARRE